MPEISQSPVCAVCWKEAPVRRKHCCGRCGEDLFMPVAEVSLCRVCRLAPPMFVRAVSCGVYESVTRGAIHALKYDRIAPVGRKLGRRLATAIALLLDEQAPRQMLVIAVPLHYSKLKERGFNQAEKLAAEAVRILRLSHPEWSLELPPSGLVRQRATESQAGLSVRQRRVNLRGAFFVPDAAAIKGRHILLVDDIYTTGATVRACSQTLVEAGAASVRVATVARAQRSAPLPFREEYEGIPAAVPIAVDSKTVH